MARNAFLPTTLICILILAISTAFANPMSPREFAPVQDGYTPTGDLKLPYAPNHLMVKFTAEGLQKSSIDIEMHRGAIYTGATGLSTLDGLAADLGVKRIVRPYDQPANKARTSTLGIDRWFKFEFDGPADIETAVSRLSADPNIEVASPDWVAFPQVVPNDAYYSNHWGHNNTAQLPGFDWGGTWAHTAAGVGTVGFDANAEAAWGASQGYGSSGTVIAIIDSGVDASHPDLLQVSGYDYGSGDTDPDDDSGEPGHGTACAGVAAAIANNAIGVAGAAGGCSIMPLKVANNAGSMYFSSIQSALYHAANNGADIASMSLGAAGITSDPATDTAIQYAYNAGVTILAATGNENDSSISYPAVNQYVISVGAASPCGDRKRSGSSTTEVNPGVNTDPNGHTCDNERWWGSNYGSTVQDNRYAVDILGPTILPTTDIQGSGGYDSGNYSMFFNGTSCATPYVAGVAALIKSQNPSWTPAQVRAQLTSTAIDIINVESAAGWDRYSGYGMVDAAAAVGAGTGPMAPVADFTETVTSGCATLFVGFTDMSSNVPTSWYWDFGDGATSTQQSPGHYYTAGGTFTVSLTATNAAGSDTKTKTALITVDAPPVANFTADVFSGLPPLTVNFTDLSTGNPTGWIWIFGDGGNAMIQNPSHTYTVPGLYDVSLLATDACGNNAVSKPGFIQVLAPPVVADFSATPTTGDAPLVVTFTDLSTGGVDAWNWDFGDGQMSNEQNPVHTYDAGGIYTVTLDANSPYAGDQMIKEMYITVNDTIPPPVADFSATPTEGCAPLSVSFTDASTGAVSSWSWDFGDGNTSTDQNPSHAYATADTFTVTLTVGGPGGADQMVKSDYVLVHEPVDADFSVSYVDAGAPVTVDFTDLSTGDPDTWLWDFGDAAVDSVQNPSHDYAPGTYDVTLTAGNSCSSDSVTKTGIVVVIGYADAGGTPTSFALFQNYPNPFNPATTIKFALTGAEHARLEVFDSAGRRVDVLVDKRMEPGSHEVTWRPRQQSSGVYFARLTAGTQTATMRLVLVR